MLATFVVLSVVPSVFVFYIIIDALAFYKEHFWAVTAVIIETRAVHLGINIYMGVWFLWLFRRFLQRKVEIQGGLSRFNNFMVYWVYLNFTLKALNALSDAVVLTMYQIMDEQQTLEILYQVTLRTLVAITDCLNMGTLLYLFYFQGRKLQSKAVDNSFPTLSVPFDANQQEKPISSETYIRIDNRSLKHIVGAPSSQNSSKQGSSLPDH